jgi:hypothetical protein
MKTESLLMLGAIGVGAWYLMKTYGPAASSSTTGRYVSGLGTRYGSGASQIPWWMNRQQYGRPPYGGAGAGWPWWAPYSPSAAFGPSPVELEAAGSLSQLASQVDAGF